MIDGNTLLLLHGDTLADSSWHKKSITNHGVSASAEQSKFGGKSLKFDGSSYLLLDGCEFGDRDFTIDWWEYVTSESSHTRFSSSYTLGAGVSPYGGLLVGYQGELVFASSSPDEDKWDLVSSQTMLSNTLNTWVHWALVRSGNTLTSYRNGVAFAIAPIEGAIGYDPAIQMAVGNYRFGDPSYFIGYIDEFRISSVARWTENFTPPDEAYSFVLITDRTAQDVDRVRLLAAKAWQDMTAEERAEWLSSLKGSYNYTDMNRVGVVLDFLRDRLVYMSYLDFGLFGMKVDWRRNDIPNIYDMIYYIRAVSLVREALAQFPTTPPVPANPERLDYLDANNIEQILLDVNTLIDNTIAAQLYSSDIYSGEV